MDSDTTSYSVYREEGIVQSGIIAMGGDEVTQSIAYAFDTSLEEAKRLKENYGVAKTLAQSDDKFIDFIQANNKEERQPVSYTHLTLPTIYSV